MTSLLTAPQSLQQLHEQTSRPTAGVLDTLKSLEGDVMILGAGGKMGLHLAAMLNRGLQQLGKGNRVLAVSRFSDPRVSTAFHELNVQTISSDLTNEEQLAGLPECPVIFYLAGFKFGGSQDADKLRLMNEELPARVARRFKSSRFVALSTGCVYSYTTPHSGGSTESDFTDPVGAYAVSCLGRETAFQNAGVECCLVRLNYSVDLRYGVLVDIAQAILDGSPIDVGMGYANVIWQGDAISYIIQSLNLATQPATVINITGSRVLSIRETAERMGKLFNRPVHITGFEGSTAWLNNAQRCFQLFGPPQVDEDRLIQWVADWLSSGGQTLGKPTHFEVRDGTF